MKEKLDNIKKQAKQKVAEIKDLQALTELRVKVLGKKGELTEILRGMKDLSPEKRWKWRYNKKSRRIIKTKRVRKKIRRRKNRYYIT